MGKQGYPVKMYLPQQNKILILYNKKYCTFCFTRLNCICLVLFKWKCMKKRLLEIIQFKHIYIHILIFVCMYFIHVNRLIVDFFQYPHQRWLSVSPLMMENNKILDIYKFDKIKLYTRLLKKYHIKPNSK